MKEKQELLQTVTARAKQLALVKQKYQTILKKSKKMKGSTSRRKQSKVGITLTKINNVLKSKPKTRVKNVVKDNNNSKVKNHSISVIKVTSESETNKVQKQICSIFDQLTWSYDKSIFEKLKVIFSHQLLITSPNFRIGNHLLIIQVVY